MNARRAQAERGIALLIVVSLLTVVGILGVTFAFSMHLETQAARSFVSTTRAKYAAEAGVSVARAVLDEDRVGSRIDEPGEAWMQALRGTDSDVDGDREPESRWWPMTDAAQAVIGRYALQVADETGKANLNAAYAGSAPGAPGAIDLSAVLRDAGLTAERAAAAAAAIEAHRAGPDGGPGRAGADDDGDGAIDDADEYQPLALRGDDRRIEALEEVAGIAGVSEEELRRLSQVATVYSRDANMSVAGHARVNVNTATADELLTVLLEAGVSDPWQAAANMADYADRDVDLSRLSKSSQTLWIPNQGPQGGWAWEAEPSGHYASDTAGEALSWSVDVPSGSFQILARGLPGATVGDISIAGQTKPSVTDGELVGTFTLTGTVRIDVANREAPGTACAFRGIELVSEEATGGIGMRGIEAVRFNELMVEPVAPFETDICGASAACRFDAQSSDWGKSVGSDHYENAGAGEATWDWDSALEAGRYYVRVYGTAAGQTVGLVRIASTTQLLRHGERHPATLTVGSDGKIRLAIGKTASGQTYYLKRVEVSVQPDGEYVELINLSDGEIDVSGWTIDGELAGGRQATLPAGAKIAAHGVLLAAVDLDDGQGTLGGNGISARGVWELPAGAPAVQLAFTGGAPSPDDDWLKTDVPSGGMTRLMLRQGAAVVDEVEYPLPLTTVAGFQSLEKADPSVVEDTDSDGMDDRWYPSLQLYTPARGNDNEGLKEVVGVETIVHDPAEEVSILSRPLAGVGELAGLPSGAPWRPFSSEDLAKIVDRLTVEGYRLEAEGHWDGAGADAAWEEHADGSFVHTDPALAAAAGRWQWEDVPDGAYRFSIYGWAGEQMAVRWEQADGQYGAWSPELSTDAQGRMVIGRVTIGSGATAPGTLRLEVRCASPSGVCHVDAVRLDPQLVRVGPVNVNTAPLAVLRALPGMTDAIASRLIAGRPYGDQDGKGRGIGDMLLGDVLSADEETKLAVFRQMAHLLTTRSDIFHILSLGQAMDGERADASQRVETIVER